MNNIYVELDAMLDTHTAVYTKLLTPEQLTELLSRDYYNRITNRFDDILPYERYLQAYGNRDLSTLKDAQITHVPTMLKSLYMELVDKCISSPMVHPPTIILDIGHYALSDGDITAIVKHLRHHIGIEDMNISITKINSLTARMLSEMEVVGAFLYDFEGWLANLFTTTSVNAKDVCLGTNIIAPLLHTSPKPCGMKELMDATTALAKITKPLCAYQPVPAKLFTTQALDPLLVQPQSTHPT